MRRFTEGGFARFNGSAPLPASTAEGPGEPIRHRYNPGGNRRIDAILYRMAITQLRCEPRAQGSTPTRAPAGTARRKPAGSSSVTPVRRHLSPHDPRPRGPARRPSPPGRMTVRGRRAVNDCPTGPSAASRAAESLTAIGDRAPPCRQGGKLDIGAFVWTLAARAPPGPEHATGDLTAPLSASQGRRAQLALIGGPSSPR